MSSNESSLKKKQQPSSSSMSQSSSVSLKQSSEDSFEEIQAMEVPFNLTNVKCEIRASENSMALLA